MVAVKKGGIHSQKGSPSPAPKYESSSHHYTFGKFCKSPTHSENQTKTIRDQIIVKQRKTGEDREQNQDEISYLGCFREIIG